MRRKFIRKEVAIPLVLLVIPGACFALPFYFFGGVILEALNLPPSTQPAWLRFFLLHGRVIARLMLLAIACALLNAAVTIFYLFRSERCQVISARRGSVS